MKSTTIYPYNANILPIIRHFTALQSAYQIEQIVSFPGSGLSGKDAGYVCNQPTLEIVVKDSIDMQSNWSTLLLNGDYLSDAKKVEEVLEKASKHQKEVISLEKDTAFIPDWKKELYTKFSVLKYPDRINVKEIGEIPSTHEIVTPIILVGGLVEQADVLEIACTLTQLLRNRGLNVEVITTNSFYRIFGFHDISEIFETGTSLANIIENINKFIYLIRRKLAPDVLIMCAPDSMIQYNSIVPNGYGIKTYMVCQAACPDYCFCSVPFDLGIPDMIEAISEDFKGRYGVKPDGIHISNLIIDSMQAIQDKKLYFSYTKMSTVEKNC